MDPLLLHRRTQVHHRLRGEPRLVRARDRLRVLLAHIPRKEERRARSGGQGC